MRKAIVAAVLGAALLCLAGPAAAELSQQGELVVSFDGDLAPSRLPRTEPAPIAISVGGTVRSSKKRGGIPQLRTISVAINDAGKLYDKGLPVCRVASIQPATEADAREHCGGAIVGHGEVTVQAHIPTQPAFQVHARLLAFNGPTVGGQKEILAQVYAQEPPGAFVLPFRISHRGGLFGTVMSTELPRGARSWAYLTSFEMTLHRIYRHAGKRRSFVSAACSAPAGFPGAVFPFAKATYGFAGGRTLHTTVVRSCHVR
jgi:hypothetical protein